MAETETDTLRQRAEQAARKAVERLRAQGLLDEPFKVHVAPEVKRTADAVVSLADTVKTAVKAIAVAVVAAYAIEFFKGVEDA